jgi:2-C-methyl-D-erythritol 4-phosphate cytidylyltransferase
MTELEVWAVVVAAGSGERLAADRPKAFVRFDGAALVAASLAVLDDHDGVSGIVCVVPAGFEERLSLAADDLGASKVAAAVAGGASRAESVSRGLAALPDSARFVLVHDAARPLLSPALVDGVLVGLATGADGVVPALPLTDTVKRVAPDGAVVETLDRAELRTVQTPQGFPVAVLRDAIHRAGPALAAATDCASLVEVAGGRVICVDGDTENLKVTSRSDLARAEAIAARRRARPERG